MAPDEARTCRAQCKSSAGKSICRSAGAGRKLHATLAQAEERERGYIPPVTRMRLCVSERFGALRPRLSQRAKGRWQVSNAGDQRPSAMGGESGYIPNSEVIDGLPAIGGALHIDDGGLFGHGGRWWAMWLRASSKRTRATMSDRARAGSAEDAAEGTASAPPVYRLCGCRRRLVISGGCDGMCAQNLSVLTLRNGATCTTSNESVDYKSNVSTGVMCFQAHVANPFWFFGFLVLMSSRGTVSIRYQHIASPNQFHKSLKDVISDQRQEGTY